MGGEKHRVGRRSGHRQFVRARRQRCGVREARAGDGTLNALAEAFRSGRADGRALLMPYLVCGYPTPEAFVSLAAACASAGADVLEIGIPFSDPVMDGPVIQRATTAVLDRGLPTAEALELVGAAAASAGIPVVVMTYYNIVYRWGLEKFSLAIASLRGSGVIVPDLVVEEAGSWRDACLAAGIAPVMLAASTSGPARLRAIADCTEGFVYATSTLGVTGVRTILSEKARGLVAELRAVTKKPIAVGIGVSSAAHAQEVAGYADGVIVGSAIVKAIQETKEPVPAVHALVGELRNAVAKR
ncbi:MAG: tryptophan synthase subunit alpha [Actinomycetota bacterium]|nr:tryptophan synthase subunit alpha [Actinomycetota bacterium]